MANITPVLMADHYLQGGSVQKPLWKSWWTNRNRLFYIYHVSSGLYFSRKTANLVTRYVLLVAWLLIFICCVVMTTFYTLSWGKFVEVKKNKNFRKIALQEFVVRMR